MTLEKKHSVMGLFKKHHHQPEPVAMGGQPQSDITLTPDAGEGEFMQKDVNFSALFVPFVKNYVSNLSANKVIFLYSLLVFLSFITESHQITLPSLLLLPRLFTATSDEPADAVH